MSRALIRVEEELEIAFTLVRPASIEGTDRSKVHRGAAYSRFLAYTTAVLYPGLHGASLHLKTPLD